MSADAGGVADGLNVDDFAIVTWLDHFAFDRRFGGNLSDKPTDGELEMHGTTSSIGIVRNVTEKWIVLSQNWPEESVREDAGMVILKAAIVLVTKLAEPPAGATP